MEVYDTCDADAVEIDDNIIINLDQITVTHVIDSGDSILIKGDSFITGDNVTYIVPADTEVELWQA